MFDTHCHLNFSAYRKRLPDVISRARKAGITRVLIPGTNIETSHRAVMIARENTGMFAAAGIHPHHVFELYVRLQDGNTLEDVVGNDLAEIESLLLVPETVAVGEVGLDRHMYIQTKYAEYRVTEEFLTIQKQVMERHIKLAVTYAKSLILHNREAADDLLAVLKANWHDSLRGRTVFHCCEANESLLQFAREHDIYIGVDGDITYGDSKREFVRSIPADRLVLETDGPYLLPEPLRSRKEYPNAPHTIPLIARRVAEWRNEPVEVILKNTEENALRLFQLV